MYKKKLQKTEKIYTSCFILTQRGLCELYVYKLIRCSHVQWKNSKVDSNKTIRKCIKFIFLLHTNKKVHYSEIFLFCRVLCLSWMFPVVCVRSLHKTADFLGAITQMTAFIVQIIHIVYFSALEKYNICREDN